VSFKKLGCTSASSPFESQERVPRILTTKTGRFVYNDASTTFILSRATLCSSVKETLVSRTLAHSRDEIFSLSLRDAAFFRSDIGFRRDIRRSTKWQTIGDNGLVESAGRSFVGTHFGFSRLSGKAVGGRWGSKTKTAFSHGPKAK